MLDKLEIKEWLELNAKLQQKKNALRGELSERGILKRGGNNKFDNYTYFSEAQYKELFTELFHKHKLELNFKELAYDTFEGSAKQANGRMPKLEFYLYDVETGFYETTIITGEGIDKGDKAGYKAYTGALKYYLADKFMVATGDDPENDSPDHKMNKKTTASDSKKADTQEVDMSGTIADTPSAVKNLKSMVQTLEVMGAYELMEDLRNMYGINQIEDVKKTDYRDMVAFLQAKYDLMKGANNE